MDEQSGCIPQVGLSHDVHAIDASPTLVWKLKESALTNCLCVCYLRRSCSRRLTVTWKSERFIPEDDFDTELICDLLPYRQLY